MLKSTNCLIMASLALSLLLSLSGCKEDTPELTFQREAYKGNELRVDGIYRSEMIDDEDNLFRFFFFYRNGVFRFGTASSDSLAYLTTDWGDGNARFIWGLFKIKEGEVMFEQWTPEDIWIYSGDILNDTTFHIDRLQNTSGSDVRDHDETFHFIEYSLKPDSVNRFVD